MMMMMMCENCGIISVHQDITSFRHHFSNPIDVKKEKVEEPVLNLWETLSHWPLVARFTVKQNSSLTITQETSNPPKHLLWHTYLVHCDDEVLTPHSLSRVLE